jgi:hypothetical protein
MILAIKVTLDAIRIQPLLAETSAVSWAVVGFCIILGLMVTLGPSKRTIEFKTPHDF